MVGEHEQRLARIEPHTHGVQDVQRRLTQALELLRLMEVQVRRTAQGDDRLSPQNLGRALCVGADDRLPGDLVHLVCGHERTTALAYVTELAAVARPVLFLKRSTQLIGRPSTSLMLNFASMALGSSG